VWSWSLPVRPPGAAVLGGVDEGLDDVDAGVVDPPDDRTEVRLDPVDGRRGRPGHGYVELHPERGDAVPVTQDGRVPQ
jgi:hypothetical protein